jgi:hypothetical protein
MLVFVVSGCNSMNEEFDAISDILLQKCAITWLSNLPPCALPAGVMRETLSLVAIGSKAYTI